MDIIQYKKNIALKIKARLEELNINRKQFAALMEVQPGQVTKWLSGTHNFTSRTLFAIESALEFNIFKYEKEKG
ncbi:MAG TPA: helix-turn-helix transcriptional regulator [Anaerovoracaceae bacterium]|nr:helix-turn-helix transcriptional regulator [Anaerovoracaceae bacterium]